MTIAAGKTASVSTTVNESNIASAVCSGTLDVFSTPMMIALMENAACAVLSDALDAGQTSVGTEISVAHTAASPLGSTITATATVTNVNGRKIEFAVSARDNNGEIGKGTHTRAIVDKAKFMAKVSGK